MYRNRDSKSPTPQHNRREAKQKEKDYPQQEKSEQETPPLKSGRPDKKDQMSSKELFFLIILYLQDPHNRYTRHFKNIKASQLLKKL